MKKPPDNPEFARFTAAMQTIMKVPKTSIQKPQSTKELGRVNQDGK